MERLFRGSWTIGPFHAHAFRLEGKGSHTILHHHEHDHLVSADKPIAVYKLGEDELEGVVPIAAGDKRLVAARCRHMIVALEDGATECECLFSRYDEHGDLLADPKMEARNPYKENCDLSTLPRIVRDLLNA